MQELRDGEVAGDRLGDGDVQVVGGGEVLEEHLGGGGEEEKGEEGAAPAP